MMKNFLRRYYMTVAAVVLILYLSLCRRTQQEVMMDIPYLDKMVHFVMYTGLVAIYIFDVFRQNISHFQVVRHLVVGCVAVIVFGILTELLQMYVTTYRSGNLPDVLANICGVFSGVVVGAFVSRPLARRIGKYF